MTNETKCKQCKKPVHFYKAVIGGKRYGDCACDEPGRATTWIMDARNITA